MFLPRVFQRLVPQFPEAQGNPPPRGMRINHLVNKALARRHKRVGETVFIFLRLHRLLLRAQAAKDNLHRALGAHHRDFGGRPGIVQIAAQMLRCHHVIGAAIGFARDDGDFGHGRLGIGE